MRLRLISRVTPVALATWTVAVFICLSTRALHADPQEAQQRASKLIVNLTGDFAGKKEFGAGIIVGLQSGQVYIVTAEHVLWKGPHVLQNVKVRVQGLSGDPVPATVEERWHDEESVRLDLGVLIVRNATELRVAVDDLPFDVLGESGGLRDGEGVHLLGYPAMSDAPSSSALSSKFLARTLDARIQFESTEVHEGHSGGGLFGEDWKLVGMIVDKRVGKGEAITIERVLEKLTAWKVPQSFIRDETSVPVTEAEIAACHGELNNWDKDGYLSLHRAARDGDLKKLKCLIRAGADPNTLTVDALGNTPLHLAAMHNQASVAKLLLKSGAKTSTRNRDWQTPLDVAANSGRFDVARVLVSSGVDVNDEARNSNGAFESPLSYAAAGGDVATIKLLVSHGADEEGQINGAGLSPLMIAATYGQSAAVEFFALRG